MSEQLDRVIARLNELGFKDAKGSLPGILSTALQEGQDVLDVLDAILDVEVSRRMEKRILGRIKASKLPTPFKTFEGFDWDFQPGLDRGRVQALTRLDFLKEAWNILITGKSGTGKSHIAQALAYLACGLNYRVRYTTCAAMLQDLFAALADHSLERKLKLYQRVDLLVIDDLGTEKVEILHGQGASLFFKVINYRYGKTSTIITSNIATSKWDDYFGDPNVTVAALDRLTHHAVPLTITGESWRVHKMKERLEGEKKKEALRKKSRSSSSARARKGA